MNRPRTLLLLALPALLAGGPTGLGEVVRPAPSIAFPMDGGKPRTLASFKGQPLILLLADSPNRGAFRTQLKELEGSFDRLAVRGTIVAAAFRGGDHGSVRTNVPLVSLPEGPSACAAFQLKGDFAIVLVGPDGNIDYQTGKVLNMNRILEVMQNSYEVQKAAQRGSGAGR
jgi:hypothetical protein